MSCTMQRRLTAARQPMGMARCVVRGGWSDGAAMLRSAARMRTQISRVDVIGFVLPAI